MGHLKVEYMNMICIVLDLFKGFAMTFFQILDGNLLTP